MQGRQPAPQRPTSLPPPSRRCQASHGHIDLAPEWVGQHRQTGSLPPFWVLAEPSHLIPFGFPDRQAARPDSSPPLLRSDTRELFSPVSQSTVVCCFPTGQSSPVIRFQPNAASETSVTTIPVPVPFNLTSPDHTSPHRCYQAVRRRGQQSALDHRARSCALMITMHRAGIPGGN